MGKKAAYIAITATVLCLSLIGIIILITLYVIANNVGFQRSVVIDAGSSSSKLNLYQWKDEPFRTNGAVEQVETLTVKPGISDSIGKPFEAYARIEPSLKTLVAKVPESELHETPIYLAATAGMRLTLLDDPLGSMELFEALRRGLQTSAFQVETPNERIRLLSGTEEGLYGWVSVNAILKLINEQKQVDQSETIGSLDLGGASTQIAFASKDKTPTGAAAIDYSLLKLYGKTYEVYSHSFLCYGKDQFEKRTKASVIGTSTGPTINNPCLHAGNTVADDADQIYNTPCIVGSYARKVFVQQLTRPAGLSKFNFLGTGDPTTCDARIREQFSRVKCTNPPCSFNNVHQPTVSGLFRAYSGFSFVMNHLFPNKVTGFTRAEVVAKVNEFCRFPWSTIVQTVRANSLSFVAKYCFDGLFVIALLDNYGFSTDEQWRSITFGPKIDGSTVSWAFGYMLDQSGHLPSESPKISLPFAAFVPVLVVLILIFAASLILLILLALNKLPRGAGDTS